MLKGFWNIFECQKSLKNFFHHFSLSIEESLHSGRYFVLLIEEDFTLNAFVHFEKGNLLHQSNLLNLFFIDKPSFADVVEQFFSF